MSVCIKLSERLERLLRVIINEAERNKEFCRKIEQVICTDSIQDKSTAKTSKRRDPAVFDPVDVISEGENVLAEKLETLTEKELKDIIAFYGMDTSKLAMKWKRRDKLINHIIEVSKRRASKGDAFR